MKNQTIYTIMCGLMMSSSLIASNDDPAFMTPNTKTAISRIDATFSPFTASIAKEEVIAEKKASYEIRQAQLKTSLLQDALRKEDEEKKKADDAKHQIEMKDLQEKLDKLRTSKTSDETALIALRAELAMTTSEFEQLKQEISKRTGDNDTLSTELSTLQVKLSALQTSSNATAGERDALALEVKEKSASLENSRKLIATFRKTVEEKRQKMLEINNQLQEKIVIEEKLTVQVKDLERQLDKKSEKLTKIEDEVFNPTLASTSSVPVASSSNPGNSGAASNVTAGTQQTGKKTTKSIKPIE